MKKTITAIAITIASFGINAQVIDVEQNSTHTFSVSVNNGVSVNPNGYTWSASAALGANFSSPNTASTNVTFTGAVNNQGSISVYASSAAQNCAGNPVSRTFRIVSQLGVNANLPSLSPICPQTSSNPTGGDIPAFTINFVNNLNNPTNVTAFSYQIVDPLNNQSTPISVTVSPASSSYNLDIATSYNNSQTGTYTIRILSITPQTGNTVYYPNASGNYPNTTVNVSLAPELTW